MGDNIIRMSDQVGFPDTEFERAAVEQVLSSIRKFKGDTGRDPRAMAFILVADGEILHYRCDHVRTAGPHSKLLYAFAAAAMSECAVD